jgi:hypothetical protein
MAADHAKDYFQVKNQTEYEVFCVSGSICGSSLEHWHRVKIAVRKGGMPRSDKKSEVPLE